MINSSTKLVGLLGDPVEHSKSPLMHNAVLEKLGLNYRYLAFQVKSEEVKEALEGIRALGIKGVNVTIPHKEAVINNLDDLSKEAELIGAVNTIENKEGRLIGHNTDGQGFVRALAEEVGFSAQGKKILIIGAGGAAKAVAFQLGLEGADELYVANRTFETAANLASNLEEKLNLSKVEALRLEEEYLKNNLPKLDLIVDTTPIGMYPQIDVEPVIGDELIEKASLVTDLVYNPVETVLLKRAKKLGVKTVSGLGMLIYQGAIAFEIWTGQEADVETMKDAILSQLEIRN
ncbi:shikimate dehydrogenase [Natroniella sulfidigena]|uniref:shikimate dehydrogenase n=1 Tax=Natroniella sulfidigena TaxID=723921 RepID=UPI00200B586F|nr:shikimate dehydrogenase [Natroniella sulfidigena]MCK8817472.1 shikimate dehydrogenase [Natroniella sulfidigena]